MLVPSTVTIAPDSGASRSGERVVPEIVTRSTRSGTLGDAASVDTGDGSSSVTSVGLSGGDGDGTAGGDEGGACANTIRVSSEATAIHDRKDKTSCCLVATGTSAVAS